MPVVTGVTNAEFPGLGLGYVYEEFRKCKGGETVGQHREDLMTMLCVARNGRVGPTRRVGTLLLLRCGCVQRHGGHALLFRQPRALA